MKIKKHKNGSYYAHIRGEHGTQEINLKTKNLDEAKQLAAEAKIEELEFAARARALTAETVVRITTGGKLSCRDALEAWRGWAATSRLSPSSIARYDTYIGAFLERGKWWDKPPSSIRATDLDRFVNPEDSAVKASTRANRLCALQSFFNLLSARGLVIGDPSREVGVKMHLLSFEQKETERFKPFTDGELDRVRKIKDPFWNVAVRLGETFGLRISDAAQLEWASFARPGRIVVWTDKHDRRIEMPLPVDVERAVAAVERTDRRYVFPEQAEIARDPKRRSQLSTYFARILTREGITGKSFHSFRHTFATVHRNQGESVDEIRLKLGHAVASTTENYIHS